VITMESADWRLYRGYEIVARRGGLFGRRRYQVWRMGENQGTFRDPIAAELHIDGLLRG